MFSPTQMGQIYLIFNQLPFLWDTSDIANIKYQTMILAGPFSRFNGKSFCFIMIT